MNITRRFINGKWEPPFTKAEQAANDARFAEMCATRQATATVGSERAFLADVGFRHHGLDDHPQWLQEMIVQKATRAGISVNGKRYYGGLADGRGVRDPEAWCATQQDFLDVVKRRNLKATSGSGLGGVNHEGMLAPPAPDVDLAPDIVDRLTKEYQQHPDYHQRPVQELKEMVVEKHGRKKKSSVKEFKPQAGFKDIES